MTRPLSEAVLLLTQQLGDALAIIKKQQNDHTSVVQQLNSTRSELDQARAAARNAEAAMVQLEKLLEKERQR